jgi:anti-sigma B factor antagonist
MNIILEPTGDIIILRLEGRLDTLTFPLLDSEMTALLEKSKYKIIVDCKDLDYVSSSGLRILLKALKQVSAAGGKFTLCGLQPQIMQVFKISGFDRLFQIYPGKSEALSSYN